MGRLKIVHIVTGLRRGGGETMLARLVTRMDPDSFANQVIALTGGDEPGEEIRNAGIPVWELGLTSSQPWRWVKLVRWLRELRPDLVQTWLYHGDILGGLAARMAGVGPISWGVHHGNLDSELNQPGILRLAWIGARLSRIVPSQIVFCSEAARRVHISHGYSADRATVIFNGFDTAQFRPDTLAAEDVRRELGLPEGSLLVGLFARFHPLKDHHAFTVAAGILARSFPAARFLLCGEGVDRENHQLGAWLQQAGIEARCHLLGRRADMPRLTAALDLSVLSSRGEALPLALGEAMACAVPCVTTNVGDAAALLGPAGRVVQPGDPEALALAMKELAGLPEAQRRQLGTQGRRRIEEMFSIGSAVVRYETHFRMLANRVSEGEAG